MLRFLYGFKKLLNIIKKVFGGTRVQILRIETQENLQFKFSIELNKDMKSHSQNTNLTVTVSYFRADKNNEICASSWFVLNHIFSGVKLCFMISFLERGKILSQRYVLLFEFKNSGKC